CQVQQIVATRIRQFGKTKVMLGPFAVVVAGLLLVTHADPQAAFPRVAPASDTIPLPRVMLWAWERPEDLRSISSAKIGVAFLARTIELGSPPASSALTNKEASGEIWFGRDSAASLGVTLRPRRQPLRVGKEAALMAVVRLETANDLWH